MKILNDCIRLRLSRRVLSYSYFTVGYNIVEGIVSIFAGALAGSIALVGFGLDSFVESLSGGVMIWRFRRHELSKEVEEKIERRAVKLVGYTFFILGVYVSYGSVSKLYYREISDPSLIGIIIAVMSIIIMPILFFMKYRTGKLLNSGSLIADSKEILACAFLSVALLAGLGLNYFYQFWQADPIIGLMISIFLIREGFGTVKEVG